MSYRMDRIGSYPVAPVHPIWNFHFQYFAKNSSQFPHLKHLTVNLTINFRLNHSSTRCTNISNLSSSSSTVGGPVLTIVNNLIVGKLGEVISFFELNLTGYPKTMLHCTNVIFIVYSRKFF